MMFQEIRSKELLLLIQLSNNHCRSGTNSCDLPEFCDGETHECPADFFVQDGLKCPDDGEVSEEDSVVIGE